MYSGSDSTESLQNQKWPAMNSMYPTTANDQIDWAALAQQWIIMKEAGPPPVPDLNPPSPPPPPNIHDVKKDHSSIEGGEAPMEVENEKEEAANSQFNENVPLNEGSSWNWDQQQQWGYSWNAPVSTNMIPKAPLLPTPGGYSQYPSIPPEATSNFQYNNKPAASEYSAGYWATSNANKAKPHNKRFSKVNVPQRQSVTPVTPTPAALQESITLDANRRKQLPAWIRDGLEKMERDKLKQLEKEKSKQENKTEVIKPKFNQKEALEIIKSTVKQRERSKFDSSGDDSNGDLKTRFKKRSMPEPVMISYDELMLRIRKTMTEILLKVTNQEILAVCKEEMQRRLRKHKASDHRVSASGGNNLSSKLGVGIYGESGSSSDESGSESGLESGDSEAELKANIRRRKAEFVKTEREIEERLAVAENPTDDGERAGTPDIYQSQVDSKYQDHKMKLTNSGIAASPKYVSLKHTAGKASSSNSSESDSDISDNKYVHSQNKRLSNSEDMLNQKYLRDHSRRVDRSESPERNTKQRSRYSSERKYTESYSRNRRSRSKSSSSRRNRSRSRERQQDYRSSKQYLKRSRSRSSSRSFRSTESSSRPSDSYYKNNRSRKSRSPSRSRHRKSNSTERFLNQSKKSRSRRRSRSYSPEDYRRRSRSRSSSRGKRSRRH